MRIFLTGTTGFIGSAILPELIGAGHQVICLTRSEDAANAIIEAGGEVHHGDLRDADTLHRGVSTADAVIHVAFEHNFAQMAESCEMDRVAIEAIGAALIGTGKRFVVTSGLPPMYGHVATERDILPPDNYGMPRRSEQVATMLMEQGVQAIVVRMSQCHDETKQGFASYLLTHAREKGVSAFVGDGLNRWPAVHRLDAARLYRRAVECGMQGQRFHAVAEEGVTVRETAEAIGRRLRLPVVTLTSETSGTHFGWLDNIAKMDVPASSDRTRAQLSWQPAERSSFIADIDQAVLSEK